MKRARNHEIPRLLFPPRSGRPRRMVVYPDPLSRQIGDEVVKYKQEVFIFILILALILTAAFFVYQERVKQPSYVPFGELEMY